MASPENSGVVSLQCVTHLPSPSHSLAGAPFSSLSGLLRERPAGDARGSPLGGSGRGRARSRRASRDGAPMGGAAAALPPAQQTHPASVSRACARQGLTPRAPAACACCYPCGLLVRIRTAFCFASSPSDALITMVHLLASLALSCSLHARFRRAERYGARRRASA